jgi:hypothetical protein
VVGDPAHFAHLIAPVPVEAFFAQYWEAAPLHLRRGDKSFYDAVLTTAALDGLIASGNLRYPAIQLARNGAFFPAEAFTKTAKHGDEMFTGLPDIAQIDAEYRAGATISLPAFHRASPSVGALTAALAEYFDHAVHANAYITPGNAAGFTPHYDTHETFILQLGGRKHWRVYEPPLTLPHRSQPFAPQGYVPPAAPLLELDLEPGDLLYLPRGYVHTTTTSESFSAHLTIGITVYTWLDLATELLQSCKTMPVFRKALPPGFASRGDGTTSLKAELVRLIDRAKTDADYDRTLQVFSHKVQTARFETGGSFHSDVVLAGPRTMLRVAKPGSYRISEKDRSAVLECAGMTLTFPLQTRPALEEIWRRKAVCADDLAGLNPEAGLVLIRYLHGKGILAPVDAPLPR